MCDVCYEYFQAAAANMSSSHGSQPASTMPTWLICTTVLLCCGCSSGGARRSGQAWLFRKVRALHQWSNHGRHRCHLHDAGAVQGVHSPAGWPWRDICWGKSACGCLQLFPWVGAVHGPVAVNDAAVAAVQNFHTVSNNLFPCWSMFEFHSRHWNCCTPDSPISFCAPAHPMILAGLEPAIFGSKDQRLIH